jgi:glutamate formiminotransferase
MVECVPNFSEGRDLKIVDLLQHAIAAVPGAAVLHRTSDTDHNRSVITFAGDAASVGEAAFRAADAAQKLIDIRTHSGAHPRVGALDVLPFVPLDGSTLEDCVQLAHETGARIWRDLGVPVYFYEAAALRPERRKLEDVRRGQFEQLRELALSDASREPDIGGPGLHPSAGAVIVGARKFLIAFNINLRTSDVSIAKDIARRIRTSNGGLPEVKALGIELPSRHLVQVSMNLTDFEVTGLDTVYLAVSHMAAERGIEIEESELIGLMPRQALERAVAGFLKLENFDTHRVVENRLEAVRFRQG